MKQNTKTQKTTQKKTEVKKPKQKKAKATPVYNRAANYAKLLLAPDSCDLPQSGVYDGELGMFHRFVSTITLNGAGDTCGYLAFCPSTGNGFHASAATAGATVTAATTNVGFPGALFLTSNAGKSRGISAKLELIPSAASMTNITGDAAAGVTTSASFSAAVVPLTVNRLFDLAKAYGPIKRETVRSSWFPSGLDHTYNTYNVGITEDHNIVYIAYRGWPAGVPMQVRITYVVEFTINPNIGMPPTGRVSVPVGHNQVVAQLQNSDPHWHHSILDEFKGAGRNIAKDIGSFAQGMLRNAMVKQAPKLLSLI